MHVSVCGFALCVNSAHSVQKRAPDALEPELRVVWMRKLWELKLGPRVRRCSQAPSHIFSPIDKTDTKEEQREVTSTRQIICGIA